MRIVVVGATGNVGTSVVEALAADDQVTEIVGIARRMPSWQPAKTEWVTADFARDDLTDHFRGADAVVHLGWLFHPIHKPTVTWDNNAVGSRRVFDAVAAAGVPALIYSSSVGAYSPGPKDRQVDESWPTDGWPTAGYTREKAYVERLLDAFELVHPHVRVVRFRPGFMFKPESAPEQRRIFAGPLLPGKLARRELIPVLPNLPDLRFQTLHSLDAGEAFRLAVMREVRGPFNLAAEPVLDIPRLAEMLGAKVVPMSTSMARAALAAAWHLHLVPASPQLFDAVLRVPLMDTTRARTELGWRPQRSAIDALEDFLAGLQHPEGMATPPLAGEAGGPARSKEFATGLGEHD